MTDEPDACQRLAALVDELAESAADGTQLLLALGERAAGIRPGLRGLVDLLRGGDNPIVGDGLLPALSDGSGRQVRHFAGTARAVVQLGPGPTRLLSQRVRADRRHSPDGRLGEVAIAFAVEVRSGDLPLRRAGDWIRRHVCEGNNDASPGID